MVPLGPIVSGPTLRMSTPARGRFLRPLHQIRALRWIVGVALVSVAATGCAAQSDPSPIASPTLPTPAESVAAQPTDTPAAETTQPAPEWTAVATFGEPGGWEVAHSVAQSGGAYVAIGARFEPVGDTGFGRIRDNMWWSPDGMLWVAVPLASEFEGATLSDVVGTGDGAFVAYGWREGDGTFIPVVLSSPNGVTWTEEETNLDANLLIGKVVRGELGYLLLGEQTAFTDPSLWLSTDGVRWEEVHHFVQDELFVQVDDIGAGEEGFVALGVQIDAADPANWERFAFASADGREWIQSTQPFGAEDRDYRPWPAMAPLGPNWVAAIAQQDDPAAIWFSPDGLAWSLATTIDGLGTTQAWSPVMAATGGRVFFSPVADVPLGQPGIWTSTNVRDWEELELGFAVAGDVVRSQEETVLAGTVYAATDASEATIWTGPPD